MDKLYNDLTGELDSMHVQGFLEAREWRSIGFIYIVFKAIRRGMAIHPLLTF
jgi:hypothetical protein